MQKQYSESHGADQIIFYSYFNLFLGDKHRLIKFRKEGRDKIKLRNNSWTWRKWEVNEVNYKNRKLKKLEENTDLDCFFTIREPKTEEKAKR